MHKRYIKKVIDTYYTKLFKCNKVKDIIVKLKLFDQINDFTRLREFSDVLAIWLSVYAFNALTAFSFLIILVTKTLGRNKAQKSQKIMR